MNDPSLCPLCGGPNACALVAGRPIEACWCHGAKIAREVLERIPSERRPQSCICSNCASPESSLDLGPPEAREQRS